MDVKPPKAFEQKLVVPDKLLMGPGPSNYPERVKKALANPVLGHMHPETFKIMDDIKAGSHVIVTGNSNQFFSLSLTIRRQISFSNQQPVDSVLISEWACGNGVRIC